MRARKTKETKSGRGWFWEAGTVLWDKQAERMPVQFIQRGGKRDSGARDDAPDERESRRQEELTVERARLTLRPCRMHKTRTRQETSKEILSKQPKQMDTRNRAHTGEGRNQKTLTNALHLNSSGWSWWPVMNMKLCFGRSITPPIKKSVSEPKKAKKQREIVPEQDRHRPLLIYFGTRRDRQLVLGSVTQPRSHQDSTSQLLRNPTGP